MLALKLIDRERDKFEVGVENDPTSKREIEAFRDRIGDIENVDQLMEDYEVYSFVMKTFGLEDQMAGKAMNAKILTSDPDDDESLVNKLTNPAFEEMNKMMGFSTEGEADWTLQSSTWQDEMVEKYISQQLVTDQINTNETVGLALEFEMKAGDMKNWYNVLADKTVAKVLRMALGFPESMAQADLDAQVRAFEKKMDIEDLQDPEAVKDIMTKYAAISDANNALNVETSPILALFSSSTSSGTWSMVTLDIEAISSVSTGYGL